MGSNARSQLIILIYLDKLHYANKGKYSSPRYWMWIVNNTGTFVMQHIERQDLMAVGFLRYTNENIQKIIKNFDPLSIV